MKNVEREREKISWFSWSTNERFFSWLCTLPLHSTEWWNVLLMLISTHEKNFIFLRRRWWGCYNSFSNEIHLSFWHSSENFNASKREAEQRIKIPSNMNCKWLSVWGLVFVMDIFSSWTRLYLVENIKSNADIVSQFSFDWWHCTMKMVNKNESF